QSNTFAQSNENHCFTKGLRVFARGADGSRSSRSDSDAAANACNADGQSSGHQTETVRGSRGGSVLCLSSGRGGFSRFRSVGGANRKGKGQDADSEEAKQLQGERTAALRAAAHGTHSENGGNNQERGGESNIQCSHDEKPPKRFQQN